jgi:prolipoprotein diacylglyceryltransferase
MMHGDMGYRRYVPVQLFEAIFLFALFALLFMRARDGKRFSLSIYAISYGVWRFVIEYARADYRGSIPTLGLTPSQLTALLMILVALLVIPLEMRIRKGLEEASGDGGDSGADAAPEDMPCGEQTDGGASVDDADTEAVDGGADE